MLTGKNLMAFAFCDCNDLKTYEIKRTCNPFQIKICHSLFTYGETFNYKNLLDNAVQSQFQKF